MNRRQRVEKLVRESLSEGEKTRAQVKRYVAIGYGRGTTRENLNRIVDQVLENMVWAAQAGMRWESVSGPLGDRTVGRFFLTMWGRQAAREANDA